MGSSRFREGQRLVVEQQGRAKGTTAVVNVAYIDGDGGYFLEVIEDGGSQWGWSRNGHIPQGYVSVGQNRYWFYSRDELEKRYFIALAKAEEYSSIDDGVRFLVRTDIDPREPYSFFATEEDAIRAIDKMTRKNEKGGTFEVIEIAARKTYKSKLTKKAHVWEATQAEPETD